MSDGDGNRVPDYRSNVLKGSLPQGPSGHPRSTEYPRLREESEKESTGEATLRGMAELYQTRCGSR